MASMRDIKRRKSSITSTQQITKAMKLVSTVRLQKCRQKAEETKPFFDAMRHTVASILQRTGSIRHPYLKDNPNGKIAVVMVTSNRGLAGGYNSNVVRLITEQNWDKSQVEIYAIGRKGREIIERKGYHILEENSDMINQPLYSDAMEVSDTLKKGFVSGEIGQIYVAFSSFKNTVVHEPQLIKLLPISYEDFEEEHAQARQKEADGEGMDALDELTLMNFEPSAESALGMIVPKYMTSILYGAMVEAMASENAARMQAMDSATNNAQDMIDHLSLMYNRARQGSITQELTEIIAGAEAIQ